MKQPAKVIDTWTPRPLPTSTSPTIPVRLLPPGVFGDQLGGNRPEPDPPLQDPEEPAADSA